MSTITYTLQEGLAIAGIILSSLIFYRVAKKVNRSKLTVEGFNLSDRSLKCQQFSNTFSASCFSFGMTLMFFYQHCFAYGLFLLFSPITYLAGQFFFAWLVKKAKVDFKNCMTISDLWFNLFPSKSVARLITAIIFTSFLSILLIELSVGSIIFSLFLPKGMFFKTIAFLIMGGLVLSYVSLGGYKALVKTDKLQLSLMMSAIIAIFAYCVIAPTHPSKSGTMVLQDLFIFTSSWKELSIFILWITLLNFTMPFSQISYWQRIAATSSVQEAWSGLIKSSWKVMLLFLLPIFGFLLLKAKGLHVNEDFNLFLLLLKDNHWIISFVLFPIIMTGLASTIFSSADVALIALFYLLSDKNTYIQPLKNMSENQLRKTLTNLSIIMLITLATFFFLQESRLDILIKSLLYAICGQLLIVAPFPIYALIKLAQTKKPTPLPINTFSDRLLFWNTNLAWFIVMLGACLTKLLDDQQWWGQTFSLFGVSIIITTIVICCILIPYKKFEEKQYVYEQ